MKTHISDNIEALRKKLNQIVLTERNPKEIYTLSTELDVWIVRYYKQQ